MEPGDLNSDSLPASPLPPTTDAGTRLSRAHRAKVCKGLLMFRLKVIEAMEDRLDKIAKYSFKLLNERDELATMLANEKEEAVRLATVLGVSVRETGYVVSYGVMLQQCFEALLEQD
ncbi:hypothetical protein PHYSODRAFT_264467 [Phytophthora sojae]|uniref:Uncharacterized protein n=1 Tax=Phytophthora sojae (strain P6497) TaxID=1094619 RepID=G4Z308_PHYSP|nr:hypothetical protein PHYSODRAFT_264467 [Phytophthora sojae]EGZ20037.1 hypothetical protein PHYSODRAFT_264467 [Phytophthora sojae]|eukprot:XP_009522754.1 hypothetical protein PHYSODRAFT_264467 [Phytophthora sojae]